MKVKIKVKYQIQIFYKGTFERHWIAVYIEEDKMSFTDNQYYSLYFGKTYSNTFREIVEFDCKYFPNEELRKYIVYDYENNVIKDIDLCLEER